ncbi:unnamed protein product [Triticum turgidum subsp. durum]|uniref:Acetyltransferase n=1 Tax=Triticum turgidum subsp. durum TaxID=4567 RepID=A0A9R1NH83_TRITD|nr:unnamed protein product [Triticum turgidum subsp. durum]
MEGGRVQIVSRRMVKPDCQTSTRPPEPETVHLTPWDLRRITVDYIQKGVVLPKPPAGAHAVEHLASSFARAVGRFYPLAGRFTVAPGATDDDGAPSPRPSLTISLRCGDEGAEFVHALAPGVTVADITGPLHVIPRVVWSFFPLSGMLGADAVVDPGRPVLAAQVTELADGLVVAMSLNHGAADGTTFWDLFNAWSGISRSGGATNGDISTVPPPPKRWFLDGCPVPIPLPFARVEDIARRFEYPPVQECSLRFSSESVKKLKAKANAEMVTGTATISSLQAVLAHLWRAVCRARGLPPDQETRCALPVGCRTRVKGMPQVYLGNAVAGAVGRTAVGEILGDGRLGWAAWLLNRAVAAADEASVRDELAAWPGNPSFKYAADCGGDPPAAMVVTGSPRFDVYGNDFGWGRPVAVRSGAGNKLDGMVTVYEAGGGTGSMELEVCLAPDALARLVADQELMDAVVGGSAY